MRPAFEQYLAGYVWFARRLHPERKGEAVKVKARTEDQLIFVEFADGSRVMVPKCYVRRAAK